MFFSVSKVVFAPGLPRYNDKKGAHKGTAKWGADKPAGPACQHGKATFAGLTTRKCMAGNAGTVRLRLYPMKPPLPKLVIVPAVLLLAACAKPGAFPSLAIRDSERVTGTLAAPPAPAFTPPPLARDTVATLGALAGRVRVAHQRFMAAEASARTSVARGAGSSVGTDAWSDAQVAVAALESIRSDAMIALADIDRIHVDTHVIGGDVAATEQVRAEASALVAQEDRVIGALLGQLGSTN